MRSSRYRVAGSVLMLFSIIAVGPALAQQDKIIASIQKSGGVIVMDPKDPTVPITFVMGANATDKEMQACAQLKTIRKVSLPAISNQVTDKGVAALSKLPELEELHIGNSQTTDAGLAKLKGLKKLKRMSLTATKISDKGMALLKEFPALEGIDVGKLNVSAAGLAQLAACKNLHTIFINDQPTLTDAVFEKLAGMPKLDRLEFARTPKVTDRSLLPLKKSSLQRLVIVGCPLITDTAVFTLKDLPQLNDLEIWQCKAVTEKSLPVFEEMKTLKKLVLSGTGISKRGVEQLRKALPMTAIRD